ncbi:MAG: serine protease [Methylococcales bacterium]|nr:serine protease [Methylococcales bacterium]
MNRIRIIAVVVLVCLAGSTLFIEYPNLSKEYLNIPDQIVRATVFVEVESIYGDTWSGSGFIIREDGLIVTAGHIVKDANEIKVTFYTGLSLIVKEFYCEDYPDADVGFIKVDFGLLPTLKLASNSNLKYGDAIYICGCPFGKDLAWTLTKGMVAGFNRVLEGLGKKCLLQVDSQSWPGNSGGPVCNEDGEVVGILIGGMYGADGISLCTTSDVISKALIKYNATKSLAEQI